MNESVRTDGQGEQGVRVRARRIALAITLLGFALLVYMVVVESEPGAIPLGLIVVGVGWLLFLRRGRR